MKKISAAAAFKVVVVLVVVAGAVALVTRPANTTGKGSEFTLRGTVVFVGERSVTVDDITVEMAAGRAVGWFDGGGHQVHDNVVDCSLLKFSERTAVGAVYVNETAAELSDVRVGDRVVLIGAIVDSYRSCRNRVTDERAVFERLELSH